MFQATMDSLDLNRVCRKDISLTLSEKESTLFKILLEANSDLQLHSTLRVAGGWVRDKVHFQFVASFVASRSSKS